jgi:hypothetical protein
MNDYQASDDDQRQGATDPKVHDVPTFTDTTTYSLSLPEIATRFQAAGIHRTTRSLQRYCDNGSIDARKYNTDKGTLWRANSKSVDLKIKEILELEETARGMTNTPPPVGDTATTADMSSSQTSDISDDNDRSTVDDNQRQSFADIDGRSFDKATDEPAIIDRQSTTDGDDKYVSVPVGVIDALTDQLAEKDRQLERRDMELERVWGERDQDRALLSQALHLIHGDSFIPALSSRKETEAPDPEPVSEIIPEPLNRHQEREGGNPPAGRNRDGV